MSKFWKPFPPPPTKLGRYRTLSPHAGVQVSPIQFGGMSIGDGWVPLGMGAMDKEQSFKLLDVYYEAGGNFIDTANNYQAETSEEFIGEWMEARGNRDQLVVATKYTMNYKLGKDVKQMVHYNGNSVKALHVSFNDSLRKLRTDYIDIFYLHWWDWNTSVEEVMDGLHHLVASGKVLYLGISDTPAWIVSKANTYARLMGKTPFVIYQGAWSILERDFEREIIPMAREEGMALAPWNVLGAGKFRTDEEEERRKKTGENGRALHNDNWERTEDERKISKALEVVAKQVGAKSITAVAIAYVMQKTPYVFPIVGQRKVEHMAANLEALDIVLTDEHIRYLESILPFSLGFPHNIFGTGEANNELFNSAGNFDKWPARQAIRPKLEQ